MNSFAMLILGVFGILLSVLMIYLRVAPKLGLFDTPNNRSSHKEETIRGAGIIYPTVLVLYGFIYGFLPLPLIVGGIFLGVVSFIDDWKNLTARLRLILHAGVITWCIFDLNWGNQLFWLIPLIAFVYLWLMNAYNFMDGINGMTALNTLSVLLALLFLNIDKPFTNSFLLFVLILATVIFSFFNLRKKAICFLGDVGSIPLGFVLIGLTLAAIYSSGDTNPLVFFAVYIIDSGWTIFQRLIAKENILKPHRKHLYQVLVNEKGLGHLTVSVAYFAIQMGVNGLYFAIDWPKHVFLIATFLCLSAGYVLIKQRLLKSV